MKFLFSIPFFFLFFGFAGAYQYNQSYQLDQCADMFSSSLDVSAFGSANKFIPFNYTLATFLLSCHDDSTPTTKVVDGYTDTMNDIGEGTCSYGYKEIASGTYNAITMIPMQEYFVNKDSQVNLTVIFSAQTCDANPGDCLVQYFLYLYDFDASSYVLYWSNQTFSASEVVINKTFIGIDKQFINHSFIRTQEKVTMYRNGGNGNTVIKYWEAYVSYADSPFYNRVNLSFDGQLLGNWSDFNSSSKTTVSLNKNISSFLESCTDLVCDLDFVFDYDNPYYPAFGVSSNFVYSSCIGDSGPSLPDVVDVISGGGSFQEILYAWNPAFYQDLKEAFENLFFFENFKVLPDKIWIFAVLLVKYTLRHPGSLVDVEVPQ